MQGERIGLIGENGCGKTEYFHDIAPAVSATAPVPVSS